jgi:hypothetical protein
MKDGSELRKAMEEICPELKELGFYTVILKKRDGY